jgi:hypothetical protein
MHACEVRDLPVTRVRENLPAPRPSDLSRTAPAADSGSPKAEHLLLDRCAYAVRTAANVCDPHHLGADPVPLPLPAL